MEKLIYLLWGDGSPDSGDELRAALLTQTVPRLAAAGSR